MEPFLKRVAEHLFSEFKKELPQSCVVLPNRRAGLFLKQYLSGLSDQPFWAPQVLSVEDLIFQLSGLQKADKFELALRFYHIYREQLEVEIEPLKTFMRWADPLLDDFNDIDYYLADAKAVFSYLSDARAIEQWNPGKNELSDFQRAYLDFYRSLYPMYAALSREMLDRGLAWPGLAARRLTEILPESTTAVEWEFLLFAGLNAITPAEQKVIDLLGERTRTDILWDTDSYYMDDAYQEAGHFLRVQRERSKKSFRWQDKHLLEKEAKIHMTGVPGKVGQAKQAAVILGERLKEGKVPGKETALVLADESILLPVLNSIPPGIGDINVTMGLQLGQSPAFRFFLSWLKLIENAELISRSTDRRNELRYRLKDLNELFSHPWIRLFQRDEGHDASVLRQELREMYTKRGLIFISPPGLAEMLARGLDPGTNWKLFFPEKAPGPKEVIEAALSLVDRLRLPLMEKQEGETGENYRMDAEYLFSMSRIWTRLSAVVRELGLPGDLNTLRILLQRLVSSERMPLSGEPLNGLQLMGMLETRALDFEHVILLSANEDILPPAGNIQSFIPMDVRSAFHLPGKRERNAVAAYHFWHLMQRSSRIDIIYNTEVGTLGGGEKSRYLHQINYELAQKNKRIKVSEEQLGLVPEIPAIFPLRVEKDAYVMDKLHKAAERGFSPSALNKFRECPLKFYLSRLERLEPDEEDPEDYGALEVGNLVHGILEKLFTPYIGRRVDDSSFREMVKGLDHACHEVFSELFGGRDPEVGKGLLLFHQGREMAAHYLNSAQRRLRSGNGQVSLIVALEQEKKTNYTFTDKDGAEKKIFLRGKADRIDEIDGIKHIIDYKTGSVNAGELKLKDMDDLEDGKGSKAFQLLVYDLLFTTSPDKPNTLSIISMRNLSGGPLVLKYAGKAELGREEREAFRKYLDSLLDELFDPSVPFSQTEDRKICRYCDFRYMCFRDGGQ